MTAIFLFSYVHFNKSARQTCHKCRG